MMGDMEKNGATNIMISGNFSDQVQEHQQDQLEHGDGNYENLLGIKEKEKQKEQQHEEFQQKQQRQEENQQEVFKEDSNVSVDAATTVANNVDIADCDDREEGEISDEFEDIISSDEELTMMKRIEELEETNAELEKIANISGIYDYGELI